MTTWTVIAIAVQLLGIASAVVAVMRTRTAPGAIAWSVALVTLPWVSMPLYWVFGRRKFQGYAERWRERKAQCAPFSERLRKDLEPLVVSMDRRLVEHGVLQSLAAWPATRGNDVDLLVDGEAKFRSLFEGIDRATRYVLVEYYIVHDDGIGRRLRDRLVAAAARGVHVYFLFDEVGSKHIDALLATLTRAGVHALPFGTRRGKGNLFQVNFRNHRKIVVVDGREAWIGGINVGDEYLGLDRSMSPWRDTHLRLEGPAVLTAQATFVLDWNWAAGELLELDWTPRVSERADRQALVFASGPADEIETAKLMFSHHINAAKRRVWVATPYFVPEPSVWSALQLAALRGADVRVLVPRNNDSRIVKFASYALMSEAESMGIRFLAMRDGFMHQKVMLVDDDIAFVGTHNFDNRSFLLNFEISVIVHDGPFASCVKSMLEDDFRRADPIDAASFAERPFPFRFAMRLARLTAPIQ